MPLSMVQKYRLEVKYTSGQDFRVGFGFRPHSGLKLTKILGLIRSRDVLFVLGAKKYNQNDLATLLNFSDDT